MTPTAYCVIAWGTLVVFVLGCFVLERRDRNADRTGAETTGQSVAYWEAEVDSWLAQLAEIRNLVMLPGDDRLSVMTAQQDPKADDTCLETMKLPAIA